MAASSLLLTPVVYNAEKAKRTLKGNRVNQSFYHWRYTKSQQNHRLHVDVCGNHLLSRRNSNIELMCSVCVTMYRIHASCIERMCWLCRYGVQSFQIR